MAERYIKLFALPENLYASGAPVIVAAGALLKDTQTGKVLAQLKLKSISPKTVKAVKIRISPLDTVNKPLDGETVYEYLDLNIERDGEFGQKNAVPLSNASTRAFSAEVTEVDFADNSVWTSAGEAWEPLNAPEAVGDFELIKQYKLHFGEKAQFKPFRERGAWVCACGGINSGTEDACHICGNRLSALLACDMKELNAEKEARLAKETAEREAEATAEKAAKEASAKKTKKILAVVIPAAAVCIAALLIITKVVVPNSNYNKAKALFDAGQYDEAIAAFEAIGGYKDSAEQITAAKKAIAEAERLAEEAKLEAENAAAYEQAESLLAAGDYDGAIAAFQTLGDYRDSEQRAMEASYSSAMALVDIGEYIEAYDLFLRIPEYEDSMEQAESIRFLRSMKMLSDAEIGDVVYFGSYEQDNNPHNGKEEIEWIVLSREDDRVLLTSSQALDNMRFDVGEKGQWESSSLRSWLNKEFVDSAFSSDEQKQILLSEQTKDLVFILTNLEYRAYRREGLLGPCEATAAAAAHGAETYSNGNCCWWLRTETRDLVSYVTANGIISGYDPGTYGQSPYAFAAVRPSIWIKTSLSR